ncbi:hypothetical protein BIW11_03070 [Tropilaelaps mercedesae]|uniref:Uncharacterized protein n=1 Tax=Tropilaelaps mercedesae TaxID=418985 RepID=A0A1V9XSH7_9ACAR|nr:hypothetical protein BIW11_03070 [Tropilaelaps mercedesae]
MSRNQDIYLVTSSSPTISRRNRPASRLSSLRVNATHCGGRFAYNISKFRASEAKDKEADENIPLPLEGDLVSRREQSVTNRQH